MKHLHHIIPKHIGGTDDPSNLIELTIEEHAEAHKKLWEEHGRWQDKLAWLGLAKLIGKEEHLHMLLSESKKNIPRDEATKEKIKQTKRLNPYHHTEEHKKKMSKVLSGRKKSPEHKEKIAASHRGKKREPFSEEWKQALKEAKQKQPFIDCPHCGLNGRGPNMKRYHFDNCKKVATWK